MFNTLDAAEDLDLDPIALRLRTMARFARSHGAKARISGNHVLVIQYDTARTFTSARKLCEWLGY